MTSTVTGLDLWTNEPTGRGRGAEGSAGLGPSGLPSGSTKEHRLMHRSEDAGIGPPASGSWAGRCSSEERVQSNGVAGIKPGRLRFVGWFVRSAVEALLLVVLYVTAHYMATAVQGWWAGFHVTVGLLTWLCLCVTVGLAASILGQLRVREGKARLLDRQGREIESEGWTMARCVEGHAPDRTAGNPVVAWPQSGGGLVCSPSGEGEKSQKHRSVTGAAGIKPGRAIVQPSGEPAPSTGGGTASELGSVGTGPALVHPMPQSGAVPLRVVGAQRRGW